MPSDTPVPLIGALLRIPLEEVHRRIIDRLHAGGFDDIGLAHMSVFHYPGPQGRRPSEITANARMSKQALHYLLNEIERLGYIERRGDPDDARSKRIVLTKRGEAARQVIRAAVGDVERDWARQLGARRFATLKTLLHELYDSLAPSDDGRARAVGKSPHTRAHG